MNFKLLEGYSAETSGGLLIQVPQKNVSLFQDELKTQFGQQSWIVGEVVEGNRQVHFKPENFQVIQVDEPLVLDE